MEINNRLFFEEEKLIIFRTYNRPLSLKNTIVDNTLKNPFDQDYKFLLINNTTFSKLYTGKYYNTYKISNNAYKKLKRYYLDIKIRKVIGDDNPYYQARYVDSKKLIMGDYEEIKDHGVWIKQIQYDFLEEYNSNNYEDFLECEYSNYIETFDDEITGEVLTKGYVDYYLTFYDIRKKNNEKIYREDIIFDQTYHWNFKGKIPNILREIISSPIKFSNSKIYLSKVKDNYVYITPDKDIIAKIKVEKYHVETLLTPLKLIE